MHETFSIRFCGKAFDEGDVSAHAVAQSLLAFDGLVRRASEAAYGRESNVEIRVKAGFRQGSFVAELECEGFPGVAGSVHQTLKELIRLGKFAFGRRVALDSSELRGDTVTITNALGRSKNFSVAAACLYNQGRTRSQLSRLTQTLDREGADSIRIYTDDDDQTAEVIGKQDREYFRHEDGVVLTDNEAEVILEVLGPMTNGAGKGWKFGEGSEGIEFTANVEDEDFLGKVRSREVKFENGTAIRAVVRTVRRKNIRTVTDRTVVEVKEVLPPSDELF